MTVSHLDQTFILTPDGGVVLADSERTLVVSDVHLGKAAAFRAGGIPIPEGDTERDLERLLRLCRSQCAGRLVIAGDLFHARAGITAELESTLARFLSGLGIPLILIRGNHDAKLRRLPAGLVALPHLDIGKLRIVHDPADAADDLLTLAGHWHPVIKIPDGRRTSLRLPCFLLRGNLLVLPSFGSFTGGATLCREPADRHFVALRGQMVELPAEALRRH